MGKAHGLDAVAQPAVAGGERAQPYVARVQIHPHFRTRETGLGDAEVVVEVLEVQRGVTGHEPERLQQLGGG